MEGGWYGVFFRPLKSSQFRVEANSFEKLTAKLPSRLRKEVQ